MLVSASWRKRFLDHLTAHSSLKKAKVHKIFSSSQLKCSGTRHRYNIQELKKAQLELHSPEKSRGEGSFGLVRCLDGADRTGEGRLIGDRDMDIGCKGTPNLQLQSNPVADPILCSNIGSYSHHSESTPLPPNALSLFRP